MTYQSQKTQKDEESHSVSTNQSTEASEIEMVVETKKEIMVEEKAQKDKKSLNIWISLSTRHQAVLLVNVACLLSTLYMVIVKKGDSMNIHYFDICFVRSAVNLASSIPVMRKYNKHPWRDVEKQHRPLLLMKSFIAVFNFNLYVVVSICLPVFITQSMMNTAPFWVAILGYIINKETINCQLMVCMIGCFVGIMVLNFPSNSNQINTQTNDNKSPYYTLAILGAALMVILSALQQVLTRRIRSVHFSIMQANYAFFACLTMIIVLAVEQYHKNESFSNLRLLKYSFQQWTCLILLSFVNYPLQMTQMVANQKEKSAFVALVSQVGVVWSFVADFLVLGTQVCQLQIVGAATIVIFNVIAVAIQLRGSEQKK